MEQNKTTDPIGIMMLRPSNSALPTLPKIPEPLKIRRAQLEDAEELSELCGRAYVGEVWDKKTTELELFDDQTVKAVLLVTNKKRIVSTASLQVHTNAPLSGQLRWVATEFDMRRQGLARLLVVHLLEIAETEGCQEVFLKTTSDALGAVSLYLQLGFKPKIRDQKEQLVWTDIFRILELA